MAQRSARVNKNSYKKPFTFPSYKIYLWGILPGKSPAETKDCLARMSWLGNIQNMWSVHDPRSHSQGLCSGVPQPLLPFLLPMTFTIWITPTHTHHLIPQGDPLENMRKSECSVDFFFLGESVVEFQPLLSFWLSFSHWASLHCSRLGYMPGLFGYFGAKWPQWVIKQE